MKPCIIFFAIWLSGCNPIKPDAPDNMKDARKVCGGYVHSVTVDEYMERFEVVCK